MPHYKDTNGGLHFLSDEDIANGGEFKGYTFEVLLRTITWTS
jgi:hypothetical protein